ncbi:MAG: T9SS type A sorting domain-containing protein [Bacteroidota bacterium]
MKQALLLLTLMSFYLSLSGQSVGGDALQVYPNPVVESFEVDYRGQLSSLRVMNMFGREVARFAYEEGKDYNIGNLPRGMYLVQFRDRQNAVVKTQRLKKQ